MHVWLAKERTRENRSWEDYREINCSSRLVYRKGGSANYRGFEKTSSYVLNRLAGPDPPNKVGNWRQTLLDDGDTWLDGCELFFVEVNEYCCCCCNQIKGLFNCSCNLKKFTQYLSHRILRHMHGVLNVDERKKN
jgi:hypothetical protein